MVSSYLYFSKGCFSIGHQILKTSEKLLILVTPYYSYSLAHSILMGVEEQKPTLASYTALEQ